MAGSDGTIKNKIVIEGEAQYKKALAEINRALRESKSEMRAVTAEYAANSTSAQALEAQIGVLERTHAQQTEQLQLMTAQLDKVEDAYGDNSREAVELRTKINNARAEMAKTGTELTQLRSRLDAAGDAGEGLAEGMEQAQGGIAQIGEEAQDAQIDVERLSASIAEAMGEKTLDFIVGGTGLKLLKDGLKDAVTWAIGEGVDGIYDRNRTTAITGEEPETVDMLTRVGDAVKRQWAGKIAMTMCSISSRLDGRGCARTVCRSASRRSPVCCRRSMVFRTCKA